MNTDRPNTWVGYLLAAGAAVMWGVSGVIARYLIGQGQHPPAELLFVRTSLAALILACWVFGVGWRRWRAAGIPAISRQDWLLFVLMGGIGLVANQGFYYLALARVGVGYALLFQYLSPVFLMAYGLLTRTERMTTGKLLAAGTAIGGCALMVLGNEGGLAGASLSGTLFALGSGVGFSFYAILGKNLQGRYSTIDMMMLAFTIAALMWALINPVWSLPWGSYDGSTWLFFIYLATVATVIPFGLFLFSLRYLEASRSSLTSMIEPVVAAMVAWSWLGEVLSTTQILGGLAVLLGIILLQAEALLRRRQAARS
ncbi:MAG: EamA family transporter [Acidobacteriota bacterium]